MTPREADIFYEPEEVDGPVPARYAERARGAEDGYRGRPRALATNDYERGYLFGLGMRQRRTRIDATRPETEAARRMIARLAGALGNAKRRQTEGQATSC